MRASRWLPIPLVGFDKGSKATWVTMGESQYHTVAAKTLSPIDQQMAMVSFQCTHSMAVSYHTGQSSDGPSLTSGLLAKPVKTGTGAISLAWLERPRGTQQCRLIQSSSESSIYHVLCWYSSVVLSQRELLARVYRSRRIPTSCFTFHDEGRLLSCPEARLVCPTSCHTLVRSFIDSKEASMRAPYLLHLRVHISCPVPAAEQSLSGCSACRFPVSGKTWCADCPASRAYSILPCGCITSPRLVPCYSMSIHLIFWWYDRG